ncbi:MAG: ATP-grasp domain-containing protein [Microthrixaceae bacterium]
MSAADGPIAAAAPPVRIALVTARDAWATDEDAEPMVAVLAEHGLHAEAAVWDDDGIDWAGFDAVVLRSPWDYIDRVEQFLSWADRVEVVTPLWNPAAVLRWNTDKHYLRDLSAAGLAVVPTTFLDAADPRADPAAALPAEGRYVVKPTVSVGSRDTARYEQHQRGDALAHIARLLGDDRDVMVQPYVDSVDEQGETGMLFFGGEFSHAFRKGALLTDGPAAVDGLYAPEQIEARVPGTDERSLADAVLDHVADRFGGTAPLYARVDVLRGDDGRPVLLELEMTEPSYFLATDPGAAGRAATAYARAIGRLGDHPPRPVT